MLMETIKYGIHELIKHLGIEVKLTRGAAMPKYAKEGDAGLDLVSREKIIIPPGERALVQTGLQMKLPEHTVGLVCSRSGLALKHGVFVLNAPGVVDSGYRGEVGVILYNSDQKLEYEVSVGDKIAQLLIVPVGYSIPLVETSSLSESDRGGSGFGSSGK